ncbi:hypothetical protein Btru_010371 [Bulinus truncatus]|nr:hypothetical protein Btru_010371 [Bulinus truncatus]
MVAPEVEKENRPAGQILKVNITTGKTEVVCEPTVNGDGGIPAGCQTDKEGNIYVADMRLGILFVQPDGHFEQLALADSEGRPMQGCNDCVMDYDGNLWVTAPAGEIAPSPYKRSFEEPFGSIYCFTKERKLIHLDDGIRFPNGIAVVHNKQGKAVQLIVAETPTRLLWSYDIFAPGTISNKTIWGQLPECGCDSGPDGMDFDETGNLLVAHWGSGYIEVFPPNGGKPVSRIKCPFDKPSNLHFETHSNVVMVTEHTNHALWSFDWDHKGMAQYCDKN